MQLERLELPGLSLRLGNRAIQSGQQDLTQQVEARSWAPR
jgi:hypothetical protein